MRQTTSKKVFSQFGDQAYYSARVQRALRIRHLGLVADQVQRRDRKRELQGPEPLGRQVARDPAHRAGGLARVLRRYRASDFRFFARRTSGTWGVLNVKLRWTGTNGQTNETVVGSLSGDPYLSWQPSPLLPLATTLPLWQSGQTLNVRLVFDPEDFGGAWTIVDVYVDPYRR